MNKIINMEEQNTDTQRPLQKIKNIKFSVLAGTAILIIVAIALYIYQYNRSTQALMKQTEESTESISAQAVETKEKIYTNDEKIEILNNLSQSVPKDTIPPNQRELILQDLAEQAPKTSNNLAI